MPDLVEMGAVSGAFGVRGEVKVRPYTDSLDYFAKGEVLTLQNSRGRQRDCTVQASRPHKNLVILSLAEVTDRDQAAALAGWEVLVPRGRMPEPEPGEYYWSDLLGMAVEDESGQSLGAVAEIIQTGSNDVYVVRDESRGGEKETLVPALDWVILDVDVTNRLMKVKLPEGL